MSTDMPTGGRRILLADYSPETILSTARILSDAGYAVASATSGRDALLSAHEHPPALALLGVNLPDMDGAEMLHRMKMDPTLRECLLVMFSGSRVDAEAEMAKLDIGADGYIAGPVSGRELLARVNAFIRIRDAETALGASRQNLERNIAEREKAEESSRRNEALLASLLLISQYQATSLQDLLDYVLDEAIRLTGSKIGYIYFYNEEKKQFTLNTWSREVMRQCSVADPLKIYDLEKTGIWGEAVRQGRVIVINDFDSTHPLMRGTPPGHAPLHKFLTTPVFDQGRIVAVVGVANKESDYDDSDIRQLALMMDSVWKIVQRTKAEVALRDAEWKFQALFEKGPIGVAYHQMIYDDSGRAVDYRFLDANEAYREFTGIDPRGKTVREAFPGIEQDPFDWIGIYATVVRTGDSVRFEQFFQQNGRYYDCTAYRYKPDQFVVAFMEITERKRTEQALLESEARYRSILDASPDAIAITDLQTQVLLASPSGAAMYGYARGEDMIGRRIADFIVPEQRKRAASAIAAMSRGVRLGPGEYRGLRADGTVFEKESNARFILDAEGKPTGFVLVVRDITERKRAEKTLRESEERLRNLVWDMQVGVLLQGSNSEIVLCNPKALELLGLTEDQLIGKTSFDPDWNVIHEDGSPFPGPTHPVPRAIASRSPVHGVVMGVRRSRNDDRVWLLVDAEPRLDEDGAVREVVCSFIDITDRKRAEKALSETNAYLENLIDHANAPIIVWDPQFRITRFNHAFEFLTGRAEAGVLGQSPAILFPPELIEDSMALIGKTLRGERWESVEIKILHRDGSIRTVLWNSATLFAKDGVTPIATIAQGQDITERKRVEEALHASTAKLENFNNQLETTVAKRTAELQASNKELESFAYSISHDLRAPLRAMEGFSDHLLKKLGDSIDGESIHHLERIRTASRRMGLLINDLLSLSQVTRLGFTDSAVDLNLIVSQILLRFGIMHPERKVQTRIMPGLSVIGDEKLLTILMQHLLDNAWKFSAIRKLAIIVVGSQTIDGQEVYFVQDNGIGFDLAWREQLFKPFTKLDGMESSPGSGIGLVTAAKIIERHGGRIWAESSPDAGATFFFTLRPGEPARSILS